VHSKSGNQIEKKSLQQSVYNSESAYFVHGIYIYFIISQQLAESKCQYQNQDSAVQDRDKYFEILSPDIGTRSLLLLNQQWACV